jgi:hypothetical protein
MLEKKKQQKQNSYDKPSDISNIADTSICASQITIGNKSSQKVVKKSLQIQSQVEINQFDKNSILMSSTRSLDDFCEDEDDAESVSESIEYSLSEVRKKPNQDDQGNTTLDGANETTCATEQNDNNGAYEERINDLSLKVKEQTKVIKQQTMEIKRLRATTVGQ